MLGHLLKREQSNQCNKLGVQTWGFGTDHKLDQVDFTARMSFLSAKPVIALTNHNDRLTYE